MKKINVLFFESGEGFGGSPQSQYILVKHFNKRAFRPVILVFHKEHFENEAEKLGVKVCTLNFSNVKQNKLYGLFEFVFGSENSFVLNLKYYLDLLLNGLFPVLKVNSIIKEENIDVVHLNNAILANLSALLSAKLLRKPVVAHVRRTENLTFLERKFFWKFVDIYFMYNDAAITAWKQTIPENKIVKVTNYIDFGLVTAKKSANFVKKELQIPLNSPVVGFIGRLVKGKGVDVFLKSAAKIISMKPSTKFVVVGTGNLEKTLKRQAVELGISEIVTFTGWRNDIYDLISCFDVLVQSTTTFPESFGRTIIEAMACGKPVVASKVPGPDEIVVDGETGFLVEPGNTKQFAEKILLLLKNKKLRTRFGKKAKIIVKEKYDVKKEILKLENIYKEVVKHKLGSK